MGYRGCVGCLFLLEREKGKGFEFSSFYQILYASGVTELYIAILRQGFGVDGTELRQVDALHLRAPIALDEGLSLQLRDNSAESVS